MIKALRSAARLRAVAGGAALVCLAAFAAPQALGQAGFPDRPIRYIIPFGPGGIADVHARILADGLSRKFGKAVIVENKAGGFGMAAVRDTLNNPPDGHTMTLFSNGTASSVSLAKNLTFDPVKDFAPVSNVVYFDFLLVVGQDAPFKTLPEFIAAARKDPGRLNVGTAAHGSSAYLVAELLKQATGIDFKVLTYRNASERSVALLRGDVAMLIDTYTVFKPQLDNKEFRVLATTTAQRTPWLPDVPTAIESGLKDFEVTSWNGVFVHAKTPLEIVKRLNTEINEVIANPEVVAKMRNLGLEASAGTPQALEDRLKNDIAKWARVIKAANIEPR
jgi:tripartite-type tricarboxylate transporter receptor subunit TctC